MPRALVLSVRFHDGRYHGQPEWPPSPAQLFQALVAGAATGKALSAEDRTALAWLEQLAPPIIVAPAVRDGKGFTNYVPNNDLDAVGGDLRRISEIRAPKLIKARLFDARMTLLYVWLSDDGEEHAKRICDIAERLYQLGRGVDMAWAWAETVDAADVEARLIKHGGAVHRPSRDGHGIAIPCPQNGSLASLEKRFEETRNRFTTIESTRKGQQLFAQASKPRFGAVPYDSPSRRFLFDLRKTTSESSFAAWPLTQVSRFVETVRDGAANRLRTALPARAATVDRVLVGRDAKESDKAARVRIIPLPSIGSVHVVRSIRRVLIEVPANCPLPAEDVAWAFSGLDVIDPETGEIKCGLIQGEKGPMLDRYGIDNGSGSEGYRVWRTVTPAVLPERAARRRIDPRKLREELTASRNNAGAEFTEVKPSGERLDEEHRATPWWRSCPRRSGPRAA
jgi:CRISPR-associated protein Csb2